MRFKENGTNMLKTLKSIKSGLRNDAVFLLWVKID